MHSKIIRAYDMGMTLKAIATRFSTTVDYVIQVVYANKVERPKQILECRRLLDEIND